MILKSVSKPGRYTGGEFGQVIKDKSKVNLRIAFGFPDTYEIGMSNLGVRLLYGSLNSMDDVWCERVYAPWPDMEEQMRTSLFSVKVFIRIHVSQEILHTFLLIWTQTF